MLFRSLAFWTVWISRWAKRYQAMGNSTRENELYGLKNNAMKILYKSGMGKLNFYQPLDPNKIHVRMCDEHWNGIESIDEDVAKSCKKCRYNVERDYYSLYYLEFFDDHTKNSYSFHVPYPIGRSFLPNKNFLEKVEHEEKEGMFRFGRPIYDEEKITFS